MLIVNGHGEDRVVVTLNQAGFGARACTEVNGIYPGIDWESGTIRIDCEKQIVEDAISRDKELPAHVKSGVYEIGKKWTSIRCPKCDTKIRKDDRYCFACGQAVKAPDNEIRHVMPG